MMSLQNKGISCFLILAASFILTGEGPALIEVFHQFAHIGDRFSSNYEAHKIHDHEEGHSHGIIQLLSHNEHHSVDQSLPFIKSLQNSVDLVKVDPVIFMESDIPNSYNFPDKYDCLSDHKMIYTPPPRII